MRSIGAAAGVCCGVHLLAAGLVGGRLLAVLTPTAAVIGLLLVLALAGRDARRARAATQAADACR